MEFQQRKLGEPALGPYPRARIPRARIPREEIDAALGLKEALLAEFAQSRLEDLYHCTELENEFGRTLRLESFIPQQLTLLTRQRSHLALSSQLRLLYGVGPTIELELREQGYRTLDDLAGHPRFGSSAGRLLQMLSQGDLHRLKAEVEHWFSPSHPLTLALTGLVAEKLVFFDLESLGLFGRPLVLLGLARPRPDGLLLEQYVIRSITEELAALAAAVGLIERAGALVTYNGRAFDVNYLEERLSYYGLQGNASRPNFDLLHHTRRSFGSRLPDCRLETIERLVLGIRRPFDVPSALVPDFYNTYLEERNIGPLVAIIEHNRQDLASLVALLAKLCAEHAPAEGVVP